MNHDQTKLRVLVAGAGAFGAEHIARLAGRTDVAIAGVADTDATALNRAGARAPGARLVSDPLRLIDDIEADAVIVASPAATHVEIGVRALTRNLSALIEKPVAPSAKAAAPLVAAARGAAGFVLPGHVLRFSRDHRRLVEIVRSGLIGDVLYVNSRRYRDDSHVTRYADADPVFTTLIHDIDLARWIAGSEFRSVRARRAGEGYRSLTALQTVTAEGIVCDLRTAWTFPGDEPPPDRLEAVGTRGGVELVAGERLTVHAEGRLTHEELAKDDDPLRNEQDHFLGRLHDRSLAPALDLGEALSSLRLADAAIESLTLGREVGLGRADPLP